MFAHLEIRGVRMKFPLIFIVFLLGMVGCSNSSQKEQLQLRGSEDALYSRDGREHQVEFQALYRSSLNDLSEIRPDYLQYEIKQVTQFLFGPLVQQSFAGIQKGEQIQVLQDQAYLKEGRVIVPYIYKATWLIRSDVAAEGALQLPLPYSVEDLRTPKWKRCTDSQDGHNTWSFFWYYWYPERSGCDHKLDKQYQIISVQIGVETQQSQISFPDYNRLIHNENGVPTLAMTFAFGYVEDNSSPDPFRDSDYGMIQFQSFYETVKSHLSSLGFKEQGISQREIIKGSGETSIGSRFEGIQNGIKVRVSVVAAAGIDQMDLFAHSFAKKHEGFFGWFGHSRVGSGFDADRFAYKLRNNPRDFSITSDYQLVYWAGCNSYSYYTLPFFYLKSTMSPETDPNGTLNLDLISNALPSLFSFNDYNAEVLLGAILNWQSPTSYQKIIDTIEAYASSSRYEVMVNVLGDEDNPQP